MHHPESLSAVFPFGLQFRNLLLFEGVEGDFADQRAGEVVPELDLPGAAPADQVLLAVGDSVFSISGPAFPGSFRTTNPLTRWTCFSSGTPITQAFATSGCL